MASILPGGPRQPSGGSGAGGGSTYPNNARYENKKVNGTIAGSTGGQPAQQQQQQQQQQMSMEVRTTKPPPPVPQTQQQVRPSGQPPAGGGQAAGGQQPQEMNGIGISNVLNSAAAPVGGGNPVDFGGIYSNAGPGDQAGLDKYLVNSGGGPPGVGGGASAGNAAGPGNGGQGGNNGGRVVVQAGPDMTNGMYGQHELVAAISQITAHDQTVASNNATGVVQQHQAKAVYNKTKKPWQDQNAAGGSGGSGGPTGGKQDYEAASNAGPRGGYGRPQNSGGGSRSANPRYSGGGNAGPGGGGPPDLSVANDGGSDSLSSTSEEVVSAAIAGESGDNGKPAILSFARIASLNLEKQAVHRPRKPIQIVAPPSENSASVTPTGGVGGVVDSQGNFVSMVGQTAPGMMAQAQMQQQQPPNTNPGLAPSMASMSVTEAVAAAAHQQAASMHHGGGGPYPNHAMAHHMAAMAAQMPAAILQLPPTNNPRFFFDIAMDGKRLGRAIIEVQASLAPKMAQNFHLLTSHEKGFGYRGCHFFQAWRNESVICGDWEHNSGRGGRAALDDGPLFTPDETKLPCIRGAVGMRRMSKKHSSLNQVYLIFLNSPKYSDGSGILN